LRVNEVRVMVRGGGLTRRVVRHAAGCSTAR